MYNYYQEYGYYYHWWLNASKMTKILVIEDDPNVADFVKRGLIQSGFDVEVSETGEQGLEIAQSGTTS